MSLTIRNAHAVTPGKDLGNVDIVVGGNRIVSVGEQRSSRNCAHAGDGEERQRSSWNCSHEAGLEVGAFPRNAMSEDFDVIDAAGLYALPGFIDIHSHGRGGADFCDLTDEAFDKIGRDKLADGVTGFLATGLTRPEEELAELCRCVERSKTRYAFRGNASTSGCSSANCTGATGGAFHGNASTSGCSSANCTGATGGAFFGATCLGVHLEGPFFNPAMAGAQNPAYLRKPDAAMVKRLHAISPIVKVSLAPELDGAEDCIRELVAAGIVVSGGHSAADYATFERARAAGMTHLTHFCNAMMPAHHLRPTMVNGGLLADDVYAEVITDGVHLSDPMIRLIAKCKGPDKVMVITDAMCAAGEPDGIYSLGGLRVKVENGKATLADVPYDPKAVVSNVAGSVALYPQCFKRYVQATGLPLEEAVKATSYNQCVSLGIPDRGEIAEGKVADIVLVDEKLDPQVTIVGGQVLWRMDSTQRRRGAEMSQTPRLRVSV